MAHHVHGHRFPVTHPLLTGDLLQTWPGKRWWQKPGPWCRFKGRLGRRGAMLLLLGLTYLIIGYGEYRRPPIHMSGAFHLLIPAAVRGFAWAVTGLLAVATAFTSAHSLQYPEPVKVEDRWWRSDAYGWLALYLMPTLLIVSFTGSWLLWLTGSHPPGPSPHGDATAWYNASIRLPFVLIVLICSGWHENPRRELCG